MTLQFSEKNDPYSLGEIEDFEKKSNIILPIEYKKFLNTNNTGSLDIYNQFKIYIQPEEGKKNGKNLIFSVWSFYSLIQQTEFLEENILIENDIMISIGDLDAGTFYICIKGENYGKIYISQVFIEYMDDLLYDKYLKVAENFDSFVKKIKHIEF